MKYSKIIICKGDNVVILAGTDNTIQALRKTENQNMTLEVKFDLKSKTMQLQEEGNNTKRLTFGKKSVWKKELIFLLHIKEKNNSITSLLLKYFLLYLISK